MFPRRNVDLSIDGKLYTHVPGLGSLEIISLAVGGPLLERRKPGKEEPKR
jgi:hypothetical protein